MMAIVVLTIAIVPMAGMFDAALRAADASGEYDEARTCAVQALEQVKSLPYESVEAGGGVCEPSGLRYEMATRPVGTDLRGTSGDEGLTMVTITVDSGEVPTAFPGSCRGGEPRRRTERGGGLHARRGDGRLDDDVCRALRALRDLRRQRQGLRLR